MHVRSQVLFFDGDDTLWENNVFFERAIEAFLDLVAHDEMPRTALRALLDDIEERNCKAFGYGATTFRRNLHECYAAVAADCPRVIAPDAIHSLADGVLQHPVEVRPGVTDTLEALGRRHRLALLTKGDRDEQERKLGEAGLRDRFEHIAIVVEKDAATYARQIAERKLDPAVTWMIGNSPRSDINPALRAGINAVLIPHPETWCLEQEPVSTEIGGGQQFLMVEHFADLVDHF